MIAHNRLLHFAFLLVLFLDVTALALNIGILHTICKPILMPLLLLLLLPQRKVAGRHPFLGLLIAGFVFAWAGDLFLLFDEKPGFFIGGLLSFLLTHVCYILFFARQPSPAVRGNQTRNFLMVLLVFTYAAILLFILLPGTGQLKIPVMVYTAIIAIMVSTCLTTRNRYYLPAWKRFALGSFLFLVSDSILALNKFGEAMSFAPPAIMLTYGLGQWFIAQGGLAQSAAVPHAVAAPAE